MNAYKYSVFIKDKLGRELTANEMKEAMRMYSEGYSVDACKKALQVTADRKASKHQFNG